MPPGSRAGTQLPVWAYRSGPIASTPLTSDVITARAIAARIAAVAGMAAVVLGLGKAARRLLDRQRLAAWEAALASTGPQRTRRQK